MREKMSPTEFLDKCEWEGGFIEGLRYGLSDDDLDDSNPEFKELISKAHTLFYQIEQVSDEALELAGHEFQ